MSGLSEDEAAIVALVGDWVDDASAHGSGIASPKIPICFICSMSFSG